MIRIFKVLAIMALIAGYAYISNQDYEDQQLVKQWNLKRK